jgi:hypothetical protein
MTRADVASAAPARQAVVVLGMHRSGTSALAGVLSALGCDGPRTPMKPNAENPKGFFEARPVARLNDEILATAGSTWDDWQAFDPDWHRSPRAVPFRDRALQVLAEEFGNSACFVLKDPRICRLLPFWAGVLQAAGCKPLIVHTHRHPLDVAASLERRNGIDPGFGQLLWLRHVLSAEADSRGLARGFTSYEALLRDWAGAIRQVERGLGQRLPRPASGAEDEVGAFLSADLWRHRQSVGQEPSQTIASPWIRDTLAILDRWAAAGKEEGDRKRLDEIRRDLDVCTPNFALSLAQARASAKALQQVRVDLRKARGELADALTDEAGRLRVAEGVLRDRDTLEQQLREAVGQADRLRGKVAALRRELVRSEQATADRVARLDAVLARRDRTIIEQRARMEGLQHVLNAVLASSSWRLTRPVRGVVNALRNFRKRR